MTDTIKFADVLLEAISTTGMTAPTARRAFDAILQGQWTPAQIGGVLVALRSKPDSPEIITAAAQSLRATMLPVEHQFDVLVDTCGTGGDGTGSLNLSTGAAIMLAAAGVAVAKHGNRAMSSRTGAADVLERLGVAISLSPTAAAQVLKEVGITFMMAPTHHPAMRHAAPVRRELGIRTLFNCLGPLANPAGAQYQLLGAYSDEIRPILAEALIRLGTKRAWVVHSTDGMDEISPFGITRVSQVDSGRVTEFEITPEDFGLRPSANGAVSGGEPDHNANALLQVISGKDHVARDAFVINAAAALTVAKPMSLPAAAQEMKHVLDSGAALQKLENWKTAVQNHSTPES